LPAASLPSSIPSPAADLSSSGGTQVESYDEDTYVCKATDTFASISQAVYRTELYGQALLLFNRNHPLATENVRRDPPVIQAGQPIYIPPMQILRKYYASAIVETATGTSRPSPAAPLRDAAASIRPLAVAPSAAVAAPAPATAPERSYRVSGNGEMLRDIARRTLGNGDRWAEIYRLNPKYDPVYPVPAGADLRLPGNARVDAQGTP
jgi:nucleoid-associated protein YgaU